jgi:hypothetical protein
MPFFGREPCAPLVTLSSVSHIMLPAIQLDRKFDFETIEIQNVRLDRKLPPELAPSKTSAAQQVPHQFFSIG